MASFNKVILMGNITREIELRHTPGGTAVAEIGLAVNDKRKGSDGEWIEEVTFVDVTLWGKQAELAKEYLDKGSPILIEGRLKLEQWEKDGQKRSKLKVVAENMRFLGGKPKEGGDSGGEQRRSSSGGSRRSGGGGDGGGKKQPDDTDTPW